MSTSRIAAALAGLALSTSLLLGLAGAANAQQAPLTVGGGGTVPYIPPGPAEPNNARDFRAPGELAYPLDAVTTQRLAVNMEYIRTDGVRDTLGGVTAYQEPDGLYIKVVVTRFTPGFKGFNLLAHGNCDPFVRNGRLELGGAADAVYNPTGAKKHAGPFGGGYLGALPKTEANQQGWIFMTLVATELTLADLRGRALVLREYDDNYKSNPNGGAGGIAACGLVR